MSTNNNAPFYVGQKVVCIKDSNSPKLPIVKGQIYTYDGPCEEFPAIACYLKEITMIDMDGTRMAFSLGRFRPINPYSTSATQELIKSVVIGDTADQPVKEIINS